MRVTRTYARLFSEEDLERLDRAITGLTQSVEKRSAFLDPAVLDALELRVKVLNAAWHLCNERVPS